MPVKMGDVLLSSRMGNGIAFGLLSKRLWASCGGYGMASGGKAVLKTHQVSSPQPVSLIFLFLQQREFNFERVS